MVHHTDRGYYCSLSAVPYILTADSIHLLTSGYLSSLYRIADAIFSDLRPEDIRRDSRKQRASPSPSPSSGRSRRARTDTSAGSASDRHVTEESEQQPTAQGAPATIVTHPEDEDSIMPDQLPSQCLPYFIDTLYEHHTHICMSIATSHTTSDARSLFGQ
jgi:hypothetical protein